MPHREQRPLRKGVKYQAKAHLEETELPIKLSFLYQGRVLETAWTVADAEGMATSLLKMVELYRRHWQGKTAETRTVKELMDSVKQSAEPKNITPTKT